MQHTTAELRKHGLTDQMVLAEVLWLNHKGVDIKTIAGQEAYIRLSRAGLSFAMNRAARWALIHYVNRLAENVVTNQEIWELEREAARKAG